MSNGNRDQFASAAIGRAFPPSAVAADFDVRFHETTDSSGITVKLFGENSNRIAVLIPSVSSSQQLFYHFYPFPQSDNGMLQAQNMNPTMITFRDFGPLVSRPFYYRISLFGPGPVITEVIYHGGRR